MDWLSAFILGLIQGLTEFLPVSSSGHLVIFQSLLGYKEHNLVFDVAVHLGTLFSILTIYRKFVVNWGREIFKNVNVKNPSNALYFFNMVIVASIPTAIIGLLFKENFESLFSSLNAVAIFLSLTGVLLFFTKNKASINAKETLEGFSEARKITWRKAILIGMAQGCAIAPGVSRSGATIATGLYLGLPGGLSALFSFMMSIPAILGASLLQLKEISQWTGDLLYPLLVGLGSSYIFGVLGLWLVLQFVKKGGLRVFSYYLWALSTLILIL